MKTRIITLPLCDNALLIPGWKYMHGCVAPRSGNAGYTCAAMGVIKRH